MKVDRMMFAAGMALALLAGAPSLAQGLDDLPDRPIARGEVIAVVKRQFAQMDANRDGVVTAAEFAAFRARQAGQSAPANPFEHVGGHWFERADTRGDGRVTLAEAEARPLQLFGMADANGDGVVSTAERRVASMMMALGGK